MVNPKMNDLKFAFRQLLKNPGFTAVAVLALALRASQQSRYAPPPFAKPPSGLGLACLGIEQSDSGNLSGVNQVPMNSHQTTKSSVPASGGTARYSGCRTGNVSPLVRCNWKARKRSPVAHLLEVRDFHVLDPILSDPSELSISML